MDESDRPTAGIAHPQRVGERITMDIHKRRKLNAAERRPIVARQYCEGKTQAEIAAHFGVNQATISRDITAIQGEWLHSSLVDFNEARARELARIDHLERTYWQSWERSLQARKTETGKTVDGNGGQRTEASYREEQTTGDPRFLTGVQWCIDRRCKLMGFDTANVGSEDKPFVVRFTWDDNSDNH